MGEEFGVMQKGELIGDGHEIAAAFLILDSVITFERSIGMPERKIERR